MLKQVEKPEVKTPPPAPGWKPVARLLLAAFVLWVVMGPREFIVWKDGKPELAPWRKAKLEREMEELDSAEQYMFFARIPGYYPCYNCFGKEEIFLNYGEVWKYGVTTKKEKGRYPQGPQYMG